MFEFLQQSYYGNSLRTWLLSLLVILLSLLLGKLAYWFFSKVVRVFTSRTKTRVDDVVVDRVEEPVVTFLIVTGIWLGLRLLVLPPAAEHAIANAYHILLALLIGWMLTRLFDAFNEEVLKPWAAKTENDLDDQLLPILSKGVKLIIWAMAISSASVTGNSEPMTSTLN